MENSHIGDFLRVAANSSMQLQKLLAIDVGIGESIREFLDVLAAETKSDTVCIATFSGDRQGELSCKKNDSCDDCKIETSIVDIAKRISERVQDSAEGSELFGLLTDEEKAVSDFQNPLYTKISFGNTVYGAIICEHPANEAWTEEQKSTVFRFAGVLAAALRNDEFYKAHLNQFNALSRILENLDANVYVSDMDTNEILFINKRMRDEFGLDEDCVGQLCWKVLQENMGAPCEFCPYETLIKNRGVPHTWEEFNSATKMHYRNTDAIIEWIDGREVHMQHSVNITEERLREEILAEAKQVAETANQAKSDFLSRMSHEIRTPINAILGFSRLAKTAKELEAALQNMHRIDAAGGQLLAIVNDILDVSRLSENTMTLVMEHFDLEKMLREIAETYSEVTEAKQQEFLLRMDSNMTRFFIGDRSRLAQVITNLLSNAAKFTPKDGKITADIREKQREGNMVTIEAVIADTGIGISEQYQQQLFTMFEQGDGSKTRKFGGTGVGLAISKSLVELMGGEISVESSEGAGSRFTFTVKMKAIEADYALAAGNGTAGYEIKKGFSRQKIDAEQIAVIQAAEEYVEAVETVKLLEFDAVAEKSKLTEEIDMSEISKYVNAEEGVGRLKGNKVIYKTLLKSYQKNTYWEQLKNDIESGDLVAAERTAHTIKGMAGNLSLTELFNIATVLDEQLKGGVDYRENYEKLGVATEKTLEYIDIVIETL